MVKVCSSGTEYLVIADNLNRKQAERIAEIITHALEEEQEESRFASSGIGTRNTIPCGRFKGLTVDDVYQQFGFEGLSLLLHCIPALLRNGMNVPEPEFLTVPYPFIVTLNNEVILYTCVTLMNSQGSISPITLKEFIRWFGDLLPEDHSGSGPIPKFQPDSLPEREQKDLLEKLNSALQEKCLTDLKNDTLQEEKIFDCDLTIPDGIYNGRRIRDVFLSDRNQGIASLLRTVRQMENGDQIYRSVLLFALTILKHREYLPFSDFLEAYGIFFPSESITALLALPKEQQNAEYERLSGCLGRRMLKSLEKKQPARLPEPTGEKRFCFSPFCLR